MKYQLRNVGLCSFRVLLLYFKILGDCVKLVVFRNSILKITCPEDYLFLKF